MATLLFLLRSCFSRATTRANFLLACVFASAPATAVMPTSELQPYPFEQLTLVTTARAGTEMAACFATIDGKIRWVRKNYRLGSHFGVIESIDSRGIVLRETILLNGDEWVESKLRWPIVEKKTDRLVKCRTPKKN